MAPEALTEPEYLRLMELVRERFREKIRKYYASEKTWEFSVSTVFVISAEKPK